MNCNSQLRTVCGGRGEEEDNEDSIILPLSQNKQEKKKILIQEMKESGCVPRQKVKKNNSFAQNLQLAYRERNKPYCPRGGKSRGDLSQLRAVTFVRRIGKRVQRIKSLEA